MRTTAQPRCPNCEGTGVVVHADLRDTVYGAPGRWSMRRCGEPRCGACWLDPAPHVDDLGIAYRGYHTHAAETPTAERRGRLARLQAEYAATHLGIPHDRADATTRMLSRLVPVFGDRRESALYAHFYLPYRTGGRLLEIGCGAGLQLATMAADGWTVQGLDFDPDAVAVARGRGLDVAVGDVRDLDLPLAAFDAIVMAQVIEHVPDPVGLLKRCFALLKPGGRLVSITPNADSVGHRLYGAAWRGLEPPRHLVIYTRRALVLACERAGLVVERIDVTARDAANLLLASARSRRIGDGALIHRPRADRGPPVGYRLLAAIERLGDAIGFACGEELVLTARR